MPQLSKALRRPLALRFQRSLTTVTDRTTPSVVRAWDDLDDYDEGSIDTFATKASTSLTTAKAVAVGQAVGFYAVLSGVKAPRIATRDIAVSAKMRDPFIAVWQALASGRPFDDAMTAGRSRIEAVVSNYIVSSARQTGDVFVAKANLHVSGWERIPESTACDWCQEVAGDTYSSAEAADFGHDRCGCTAAPAF